MKTAIQLLDCTLRDGAYITGGDFGAPCIQGIVKKCEKFYPRIELRLFLSNIAFFMRPMMNSQAGSEAAAKAMELLRNCSDNITLYNQSPASALEILLRDMFALNNSFGGVFCAAM